MKNILVFNINGQCDIFPVYWRLVGKVGPGFIFSIAGAEKSPKPGFSRQLFFQGFFQAFQPDIVDICKPEGLAGQIIIGIFPFNFFF